MLEKFEDLYRQYKGYLGKAEEHNKTYEDRRKNAIEKVKNATEDEVYELYLELEAFPYKLNYDMDLLIDRMLTVYNLIPEEVEVSESVKEEMKTLNKMRTFYIYVDGDFKKVNDDFHDEYDSRYRQIVSQGK